MPLLTSICVNATAFAYADIKRSIVAVAAKRHTKCAQNPLFRILYSPAVGRDMFPLLVCRRQTIDRSLCKAFGRASNGAKRNGRIERPVIGVSNASALFQLSVGAQQLGLVGLLP